MSRLIDLIAQAKGKDSDLGRELEREFKALTNCRAFGLNFERHRPESVELSGRSVRKGDKVYVFTPTRRDEEGRPADLEGVQAVGQGGRAHDAGGTDRCGKAEMQEVAVADMIVVVEFRDYIYPRLVSTGKVERGGDKPCRAFQCMCCVDPLNPPDKPDCWL